MDIFDRIFALKILRCFSPFMQNTKKNEGLCVRWSDKKPPAEELLRAALIVYRVICLL